MCERLSIRCGNRIPGLRPVLQERPFQGRGLYELMEDFEPESLEFLGGGAEAPGGLFDLSLERGRALLQIQVEDLLLDFHAALEVLVQRLEALDEVVLVVREEFPAGGQGRKADGDIGHGTLLFLGLASGKEWTAFAHTIMSGCFFWYDVSALGGAPPVSPLSYPA